MSNPFRGSDTAADMIGSEDISNFHTFMQNSLNMGSLREQFAEMDRIAATGDEALFEQRFGHLSRPRPDPTGPCVLNEEASDHPLCAICRKIFAEDIQTNRSWTPPVNERYAHYKTLEELHSTATGGCPLCAMLWTHIAADYCIKFDPNMSYTPLWDSRRPRFTFDYISYSISEAKEANDAYLLNFVYGGNDSVWDYDTVHSVQLGLIAVADSGYALHQGEVSQSTGSHSALDFASRCMQRCEQSHKKCSQSTLGSWKPTRLIDLGPLDQPVTTRLITTEDHPTSIACYATLSHRWGGAAVFQLKENNLDALQLEIPSDKLSKTFQDAFVAAKKLRIRHIWVDSLCIVQDSSDDWTKEASLMKDVYSNAKINISATGAETGDDGLFFDRGSLAVVPCTLAISKTENASAWKPGHYRLVNPSLWSSNISQAPLNQRGWVLQERVLAARIVHFGRDQLFFECRELDACEMYPDGLPDLKMFQQRALGAPSSGHFKRLDLELDGAWLRETKSMGRLKSDPALDDFSVWAELVEAYSALTLTKWEDKLVAFSGVAKMMQQRPEMAGDEYLAGLWRRHLPYHLLWSRRKDGGLGTEPMMYIAPSWSWASVQAPVTLHPVTDGVDEAILVDILEAETFTSGADVTGSVFGGYVKLKGFLRSAVCAVWRDQGPGLRRRQTTSRMDRTRLAMTRDGGPADIIVWPDETDMFGPESGPRRAVYCLPVQTWRNEKGDRCTEGLIIERMEFDPDAFKRMGKFKIAVGQNDGQRQFYTVENEVWETAGGSAKAVMQKAGAFNERVITLV